MGEGWSSVIVIFGVFIDIDFGRSPGEDCAIAPTRFGFVCGVSGTL